MASCMQQYHYQRTFLSLEEHTNRFSTSSFVLKRNFIQFCVRQKSSTTAANVILPRLQAVHRDSQTRPSMAHARRATRATRQANALQHHCCNTMLKSHAQRTHRIHMRSSLLLYLPMTAEIVDALRCVANASNNTSVTLTAQCQLRQTY